MNANQLIFGNGSNEIIEFVAHALIGPGTNIVVSQYCFAIYPIVAHLTGADCITVPAKDYGHNLPAMREAITPDTHIVFVANPTTLPAPSPRTKMSWRSSMLSRNIRYWSWMRPISSF